MRMWLLRVWRWRKCVPQISQGYGFSPVWINTWARRWATWDRIKKKKRWFQTVLVPQTQRQVISSHTLLTWTNLEPHVSHLYGFSPEWMRVWVLRLAGRLNWAPHMLQWYGFAPGTQDQPFEIHSRRAAPVKDGVRATCSHLYEPSCGWPGCPCSERQPGSSRTCMACHCGPGPCVLLENHHLGTWSHTLCRSMLCCLLKKGGDLFSTIYIYKSLVVLTQYKGIILMCTHHSWTNTPSAFWYCHLCCTSLEKVCQCPCTEGCHSCRRSVCNGCAKDRYRSYTETFKSKIQLFPFDMEVSFTWYCHSCQQSEIWAGPLFVHWIPHLTGPHCLHLLQYSYRGSTWGTKTWLHRCLYCPRYETGS